MTIRTRFAPSPTGYLHIGGVRTALFSWLYARKNRGFFVLRIEDTDRERSTEESVNVILEGMKWLGLDYQEGPFFQTQRFDRYQEVIQKLLDEDKAYYCYCSKEELQQMREEQMARKEKPRYDGRCRQRTGPMGREKPVVRFKNPLVGQVVVDDLIRGQVVFNNSELDDLIIARADGTPTYNLTVVVDDFDMRITHVIRGDDHLNNTPRQINILKAQGATIPAYAHVPMILTADGQRLSKRHGAVSVLQYRDAGYLPEALLNYLVRLGWSYGDQEIFSIDEMAELFDIKDVNRAPSTFNPDKLLWLNHHYLMSSDPEYVAKQLALHMERLGLDLTQGPALKEVVKIQRERTKTLVEMAERSRFFYCDFDAYDEKAARKNLKSSVLESFIRLRTRLAALELWSSETIHQAIEDIAEAYELKLGQLAQPVRVAVVGGPVSPPIDVTLQLLGQEKTLARMDRAIEYIHTQAQTAVSSNGCIPKI